MIKELKLFLGIFLFLAVSRFIPHPPNFTSLIALSFYVPAILGIRYMPVVMISFVITDLFIGFHSTLFFTWGSVVLIGLMSKFFSNSLLKRLGGALTGAFIFFLVTNFAVWLAWDYYPKTIEGLILCYTMAIPFFQNTLISTCLFTGVLTLMIKPLEKINEKTNNMVLYIVQFAGHSK